MKKVLLTTLFAAALGLAGPASAVIINEFGDLGIDGDLLILPAM